MTESLPTSAVTGITSAEIETQIATARAYPRDIEAACKRTCDLACLDEDTAQACWYRLERGEKPIEGPSVRLAEIAVSQWGNLRTGARITAETDQHVIAQGVFHDLETNVAITVEVKRSIVGRYGRYSPDMIVVTSNAACAIAFRNVVFKGIPAAFINKAYEAARKYAIGDANQLPDRVKKMVKAYDSIGVTDDELLSYIERKSESDITLDDVARMLGIFNSIKEGQTSTDVVFRGKNNDPQQGASIDDMEGRLSNGR
jgi:hypothetical protein